MPISGIPYTQPHGIFIVSDSSAPPFPDAHGPGPAMSRAMPHPAGDASPSKAPLNETPINRASLNEASLNEVLPIKVPPNEVSPRRRARP